MRIIQAIALAAAVLGLLLTTPSLEARTRKKTAHKKMKIVFDGSPPAVSEGELGDEIAARSSNRQYHDKREVVKLRGGTMDDAWKKAALKKSAVEEENPDLIEPSSFAGAGVGADAEVEAPASQRSKQPVLLATGSSIDESALGSFKTSPKKTKAKKQTASSKLAVKLPKAPKRVAQRDQVDEALTTQPVVTVSSQTRPAPIQDTLDFDDVKTPKQSQRTTVRAARAVVQLETPTKAQSKIYLRNVQPVARAQTRIAAPTGTPSEFKFNFAFENTTSLGRAQELQTPGGRNYMMKNEIFVGADHSSGWGAKLAANYINTSNDNTAKDIREMGDPSLIISHPSLYKSIDINVRGQGRYYLPVAALSKKNDLHQLAYSLLADVQLVEGLELSNDLTGRYYIQASYADADAFALIFDRTEIAKRFDSFKLGIGQRTQVESHQAIAPGTSIELYPFAELLAITNTVLQAKLYVPLLASGLVNGAPGSPSGPLGVGFSNVQAEISARISF